MYKKQRNKSRKKKMLGGTQKDRYGNPFTRDYAVKLLGITPDQTVTDELIRHKYYKKARKTHPDISKDPDAKAQFQEVSNAYNFLTSNTDNDQVSDNRSQEEKERDSREERKARFNALFKKHREKRSAQPKNVSKNDHVNPATIHFFCIHDKSESSLVITNEKTIEDLKYNYLMINQGWNEVNNDPPIGVMDFYLDDPANKLDNENTLKFYGIQDGSDIVVDLDLAKFYKAIKKAQPASEPTSDPRTAAEPSAPEHHHSPPHRAAEPAAPEHDPTVEEATQPSASEQKQKKSYLESFFSYFSYPRDSTKKGSGSYFFYPDSSTRKNYLSGFFKGFKNPFRRTKKGGYLRLKKSRKIKTLQQ